MSEFVCILTNPAIPDLVNIGWTKKDIVRQIRELSNHPGVPAPFECFYCCEVEDGVGNRAEAEIHLKLKNLRFNPLSSFFRIDPDIVKIFIEKKWAKEDMTPNEDAFMSPPQQSYTHSRRHTKAPPSTFSMLNISIGSELTFDKDTAKVVKVVGDRTVEYRGRVNYLSTITRDIYNEGEYPGRKKSGAYRGTDYWSFEGENLTSRRLRLEDSSKRHENSKSNGGKLSGKMKRFENSFDYHGNSKIECPNLEFTRPVKATINGKHVSVLGWNPIMRELLEIAAKNPNNSGRFKEIFNVELIPGFVEGPHHVYVNGVRSSIRGLSANNAGRAIIKGATKLGFEVYIEYEWTDKAESSKQGKICDTPIRINC